MSSLTALLPLTGTISALGDLCPLTPLGNRPEDVREWNDVYGEDPKPLKEDLSWIERRDRYNEKIIQERQEKLLYVARMVEKYAEGECPVKSFAAATRHAMKKAGLPCKSRTSQAKTVAYVRAYLKEHGIDYEEKRLDAKTRRKFLHVANSAISHYKKHGNRKIEVVIAWAIKKYGYKFSGEQMQKLLCFVKKLLQSHNIDWEILSGGKNTKCPTLCIRRKNKEIRSKTAGRGKGKYAPNLVKAAFAILRGRKKRFGFGRYWCRNDEDWVTCKSLHYDNCKVIFSEKVLFKPIYELIKLGAKAKDIVCEYGILLHKHHGLAVDSEASTWQPTGLAKELKENVYRKYLGL